MQYLVPFRRKNGTWSPLSLSHLEASCHLDLYSSKCKTISFFLIVIKIVNKAWFNNSVYGFETGTSFSLHFGLTKFTTYMDLCSSSSWSCWSSQFVSPLCAHTFSWMLKTIGGNGLLSLPQLLRRAMCTCTQSTISSLRLSKYLKRQNINIPRMWGSE